MPLIFNLGLDLRSPIQRLLDSAQSIQIQRQALVATSMSRNGRMLTAARNWGKPWKFTVQPVPVVKWTDESRQLFEELMNKDRIEEHTIKLGQNAGSAWTVRYLGDLDNMTGLTVNGANSTGTNLRLNLDSTLQALPLTTVIFRAGDIIQPDSHRYPYVVRENVLRGTTTYVNVPLHRGLLPDTTALDGQTMRAGVDCSWEVKFTKLPTIILLPGQLAEFNGELELIESII